LDHANDLAEKDSGLEIRIAPAEEFRVLLRSAYADTKDSMDMATRSRETEKHAFLLSEHAKQRKQAFETTAANAATRQMGELKYTHEDKAAFYAEEFQAHKKVSLIKPAPRVKSISKALEIRLQKYAAIAVIPDYEHSYAVDGVLSFWEQQRDSAYAKKRNEAVSAALNGRPLPSMQDLTSEFVEKHPPPKHCNVWGQKSDDIWTRSEAAVEADSDVQAWLQTFRDYKESALWKWLELEVPTRAETLKEWISQNPLPSVEGAEPAVAFLKASETEAELKEWIASAHAWKDYDIACVAMYEWIKVSNAWSDNVMRSFRNPMVAKLYEKKNFQKEEASKLSGEVKTIEITN